MVPFGKNFIFEYKLKLNPPQKAKCKFQVVATFNIVKLVKIVKMSKFLNFQIVKLAKMSTFVYVAIVITDISMFFFLASDLRTLILSLLQDIKLTSST